jgi:hypothetical protein
MKYEIYSIITTSKDQSGSLIILIENSNLSQHKKIDMIVRLMDSKNTYYIGVKDKK